MSNDISGLVSALPLPDSLTTLEDTVVAQLLQMDYEERHIRAYIRFALAAGFRLGALHALLAARGDGNPKQTAFAGEGFDA